MLRRLALVSLLTSSGCDWGRCDQSLCVSSFAVRVLPAESQSFAPGEYTFIATFDTTTSTVPCTVGPRPAMDTRCAPGAFQVAPSVGPEGIVAFLVSFSDVPRVTLAIRTVCVGADLARMAFAPKYTVHPATRCDNECRSASATMTARSATGLTICSDAGVDSSSDVPDGPVGE